MEFDAFVVASDLSNRRRLRRWSIRVIAHYGRIDILTVNNAGASWGARQSNIRWTPGTRF